jgi:transcriptional regulator with XRE-family HTH domain
MFVKQFENAIFVLHVYRIAFAVIKRQRVVIRPDRHDRRFAYTPFRYRYARLTGIAQFNRVRNFLRWPRADRSGLHESVLDFTGYLLRAGVFHVKHRVGKDLAKLLFLYESLTQKEIAARVGVSEVTLSKWANAGQWESHKVSITMTKEEQLKNHYHQLAELNNAILQKEEGKRFANKEEANIITQLTNAIEKMEADAGVADIVNVSKKFMIWIRKFDLAKAQDIAPLFDAFIKDSIK